MKKTISIILVSLLAALSLHAEIKTTLYPNGKVKFVRTYDNGKLNGVARAYYPNGKLKTHTTFLDGKVHGLTTGFYEDGAVKAEIPMYKGKLDGYQKSFIPTVSSALFASSKTVSMLEPKRSTIPMETSKQSFTLMRMAGLTGLQWNTTETEIKSFRSRWKTV